MTVSFFKNTQVLEQVPPEYFLELSVSSKVVPANLQPTCYSFRSNNKVNYSVPILYQRKMTIKKKNTVQNVLKKSHQNHHTNKKHQHHQQHTHTDEKYSNKKTVFYRTNIQKQPFIIPKKLQLRNCENNINIYIYKKFSA